MEEVYLFGASNLGAEAYESLKNRYKIISFIDNDSKKWGNLLKGKKIVSPSDIFLNSKIIITSTYWREIIVQLIKIKIINFNVFFKNDNNFIIIKMQYENNNLICNNLDELSYLKNRKIKLYYLRISNLINVVCRENIKINLVNKNNTLDILDYRNEEVYKNFIKMLEKNQIGVYAKCDEKVVGHAWCIINNDLNIVQDIFLMQKRTAMIHFCNVDKKHRGKSIYPYMLYTLIMYVKNRFDIEDFYISTDYDNISSQIGVHKIGFNLEDEIQFYYYDDNCINISSILNKK
ncbi:GNAT family N-acetyltransferase [Clostridium botulinum]|uniref:GNAT family N-acetyltransferase n=1 Tax=Clostridium botulinum TaxID=1491 RepID=UPI002493B3B9|nr:GNAT family N-acetyltransferase [Clostridium botulinum]BDB02547.1 hypothetical protein CBOS2020_26210 [Clostridium botulinum]